MFVKTVISVDYYTVDVSLRTFHNSQFEIDRVFLDVDFHWSKVEKEVTLIHVKCTDTVFVCIDAIVEFLLVIYIAFLHLKVAQKSLA